MDRGFKPGRPAVKQRRKGGGCDVGKVYSFVKQRNCYMLTTGRQGFFLTLVCCLSRSKGLNFETSTIAAALISHEHIDYSKAVKDLINRDRRNASRDIRRLEGKRLQGKVEGKGRFTVNLAVMPSAA